MYKAFKQFEKQGKVIDTIFLSKFIRQNKILFTKDFF